MPVFPGFLEIIRVVLTTVTNIKENADDILADAKDINNERAEKEAEAVIGRFEPKADEEGGCDEV